MTREEARVWWDQPGTVKLSPAVLAIRWVFIPEREPQAKTEGVVGRMEKEGLR